MMSISLFLLIMMTLYCHSYKLPSLPSQRTLVNRRKLMISRISTHTHDAMKWYMDSLVSSPIITKGITTGVIEVLGDGIAQVADRKEDEVNKWEYRRSLGCFVDGVFITGPLLHWTYDFLEHIIPSIGGSAWATLAQVMIDEFICDPIDVGLYLIATSIVEGKNVMERLREKYWITLIEGMATSLALCPIQFISFRYLPVETRVLVVNLCDLIWMSIVSYIAHAKNAAPTVGHETISQELQQ